jgi:hypothetical protein
MHINVILINPLKTKSIQNSYKLSRFRPTSKHLFYFHRQILKKWRTRRLYGVGVKGYGLSIWETARSQVSEVCRHATDQSSHNGLHTLVAHVQRHAHSRGSRTMTRTLAWLMHNGLDSLVAHAQWHAHSRGSCTMAYTFAWLMHNDPHILHTQWLWCAFAADMTQLLDVCSYWARHCAEQHTARPLPLWYRQVETHTNVLSAQPFLRIFMKFGLRHMQSRDDVHIYTACRFRIHQSRMATLHWYARASRWAANFKTIKRKWRLKATVIYSKLC